jgi:hypothetical protein
MARERDQGVAALVERCGRLVGEIDRLERELSTERQSAARQREACASHLDQEARLAQLAAEQCSGQPRTTQLALADALRSIAAEMRARAVVR